MGNKQLFFSVLAALGFTMLIMFAFEYFGWTSHQNSSIEHPILVNKEQQKILEILGADFKAIDSETAKRLKINGGVRLINLHVGRLKQQTEIREGFIITKVNGQVIKSLSDLLNFMEDKQDGVMLEGIYEPLSDVFDYSIKI